MVVYENSGVGYRFVLTELGMEQAKVRGKFDEGSSLYKQYAHSVPKLWIENGWVKRIKEDNQVCM